MNEGGAGGVTFLLIIITSNIKFCTTDTDILPVEVLHSSARQPFFLQ